MGEPIRSSPAIIGRENELDTLKQHLADAMSGKGCTVLISGEPGIGKTRLVEEFRKHAESEGARILSGAAMSGSAHPFQVFSKAFEGVTDKPLFEEQEFTSFTEIFAVNGAGLLLAKASSEEGGLDADIFAGMLSAVQDFVRDSFGGGKAGLGRLEYGDMKILIEHGQHLFLTAVFSGTEHPDMRNTVTRTLKRIEDSHGRLIERWSGRMSDIEPVQDEIMKLAGARFLVRKDLEGVKLENERLRIADKTFETLVGLCGEKPLVLFLEDLHWADESSLFVLNYLARNIRRHPVILLGTSRPRESDALEKAIENMKDEEIVNEMALVKLDVDCTKSLINLTFVPNDFPDTLAERLYEQSKGNPLFVTEMLKGMFQDGSIEEKDGKYTLVSESYTVPATVEEAVNRRLEALDPDSMAMVEYASCIGQKFEEFLAASNRMIGDVEAPLERLLELEILQRKDGTLEFSHAVFRSVIYNGIGDRWKTSHHRNIGECFETTYADRSDDVIYDLGRHFSKTKEFRKASDYCIRAGEKAETSFAVELALEFYNDALDALSRLGNGHYHDRALDILERVGDIQTVMADYDGAIGNYLKVRDSSADRNSMARMLRKVATVQEKKGESDRSLEVLAQAKELIEDKGSAEFARLLLCEGTSHFGKGDYDMAMPLFQDAIAHFGNVASDLRDMGNALRAVGNIHLNKGEYMPALEYYRKSLAVMESADDKDGIASALNNMGIIHCNRGEFEKGLELYSRSLEIQEKIGDTQGIALSLNNIGIVYHVKGQLDKVLEFYGRSLEMRERIGDKRGIAHTLTNIGSVHHELGELDNAMLFYGRSLEMAEKIGDRRGIAGSLYYTGTVHQDRGESEAALELFGRGLDMYLEMGDERNAIYNYCRMAEEYLGLGNDSASLEYAEKAIDTATRMGAEFEEGIIHMVLGAIHRGSGDYEKADEELERARAIFEGAEEKNVKELARLQYEYGRLWGAKGDPEKARESLEKALPEFEGMGMNLWAEKCRNALQELDP